MSFETDSQANVAYGEGEVLLLLEIWRGAPFADENQQTGFGEPGKGSTPWQQEYLLRSALVKS